MKNELLTETKVDDLFIEPASLVPFCFAVDARKAEP